MKQLWVEKYRPTKLEDYVCANENVRAVLEKWITEKCTPNIIFSGTAGVGKTTAAKLLLLEIGVHPVDILIINASSDGRIADIRELINGFVSTLGFDDIKYVLLDEADYLTPAAQAALRNAMETYSNSVRFMLTCNYSNKIIPALHSRCHQIHIDKLDRTQYTMRAATILIEEGMSFELETLDEYVNKHYPDLRKCINTMQSNCVDGILKSLEAGVDVKDYRIDSVELFKQGRYKDARDMICKNILPDEYEDMYRFMYTNLPLWSDDQSKQEELILIIKSGLVDHALIADPEICLCATLIKMERMLG